MKNDKYFEFSIGIIGVIICLIILLCTSCTQVPYSAKVVNKYTRVYQEKRYKEASIFPLDFIHVTHPAHPIHVASRSAARRRKEQSTYYVDITTYWLEVESYRGHEHIKVSKKTYDNRQIGQFVKLTYYKFL